MSHISGNDDSSFREQQERYRDTVFLPRTSFPMRGNLPSREPELLKHWENSGLDEAIKQADACKDAVFTLHDGPPYANGHIHIGHALNKIMKDVINRAHRMAGFQVRYMPGWDCHGLPIEWKVEELYRKKGKDKDSIPVLQFRAECRDYAAKWVDAQREDFKRIGVQAEWAHRYVTMDYRSEAQILEEIGKFLLNGRLYRGLRPVMWSPVEKTALAEAEIEYHDVVSPTIYVAFPVMEDKTSGHILAGASAVIWTTTPWTIPANRAMACGPEIAYSVLEVTNVTDESKVPAGTKLIIATERLEAFASEVGIISWNLLHNLAGSELAGSIFAHPLRGKGYDFDVPMLAGDFVTTDAGTGIVHMAPSHGQDDFQLCTSHGMEVPELVQDNGCYASWVPEFAGLHVFKAADPVCELLDQARLEGMKEKRAIGLMARSTISHSYPHSWRSKKPIIFRATPQWFIAMEGEHGQFLREQALDALEKVEFVPSQSRRRLTTMVAQRPDWCISRQRSWGVPIAVFVEKRTGTVLRDAEVMARIVAAFKERGADAWYDTDPSEFLGEGRDPDDYEQVFDIVDVWFESGCSHRFVLHQEGVNFPADLYLEGSDQHRGWFQSSLLESVGAEGVAPYKAVVTNGFVLDGQGRKMSKSLGNTIVPDDVTKTLGADVLRLWVLNSDTHEDLRISQEILKQQGELYRRLRNTLRWLLGALDGFEEGEKLPYEALPSLERYILHRLNEVYDCLKTAIETHQWTGVYPALHGFCNNDLSAFYFDIRKDSLYCDGEDSKTRRAVRTVLDILHHALTTWLAPALVFTAEESWQARFGKQESVHLQSLLVPDAQWHAPVLARKWEILRGARAAATASLEALRRSGEIGSSLEAELNLSFTKEVKDITEEEHIKWDELCIASQVKFLPVGHEVVAKASRAEGHKCARCWRVLPEVGGNSSHPALCLRCVDAVES